jgi:hypothetical protein
MPIPQTLKTVGRWTRRIIHATTLIVGGLVIASLIALMIIGYNTPQDSHAAAVRHEFEVQVAELDHRIHVCNSMIDGMIPGTSYVNGAASHCALMWTQMKHLELFVVEMHISKSNIDPLIEGSLRAAARYAEYQKAMNRPQYNPYE